MDAFIKKQLNEYKSNEEKCNNQYKRVLKEMIKDAKMMRIRKEELFNQKFAQKRITFKRSLRYTKEQ